MSQLSDKLCASPRGLLAVSVALLAALLATPGEAQVTNWSLGDADGSWSVAGNWDNGIPNSDTADAQFLETDLTALRTITLTENIAVNALRFTDKETPHFRLEIAPTGSETFTFAGTNPVIESGSSSGGDAALRIFAPVVVGSGGLTKTGEGSAAFMSTITGSGTLTFSGGTTEMRGNSTGFTGDIVINSGAVVQARIPRLVYGATDDKAGAAGTLYNVCQDSRLNHCLDVRAGVLAAESVALLRRFFQARR